MARSHPASSPPPALFGRDREVTALVELLAGSDLVTISGPGGIGKSVLAAAAAPRAASALDLERVVAVDLHEAGDSGSAAAVVLAALGGTAAASEAPAAAVGRILREAAGLLVILDGCESIIDVVREVVVARGAEGARVLVTSQIELGLASERILRLDLLPVPGRQATGRELADSPSVRLYVDRRTRVDLGYRLEDDPPAAVVELLVRVEGHPLAIELAAARGRSLSTADLVGRIDDALELLSVDAPDVPRRQRCMAAAVAWSWSLLSVPARELLAAASAFAGPFTLASLEAIAAPDPVEVDALDDLIAHSLLQVLPGEPRRYRLLDSIRAYARAQQEPGRRLELRLRHARLAVASREAYVLAFMRDGPSGAPPAEVRSVDDLRAAYRTSLEAGDLALASRAATALSGALAWLGLVADVRAVLIDALTRAEGGTLDDETWAQLATHFMSVLDDAPPLGSAGVARLTAIAGRTSDLFTRCRALRILSVLSYRRGDLDRALALGAEGLEAARAAGLRLELSFILGNQSKIAKVAGRVDQALACAEESVRTARSLGMSIATGTALAALAACQIETGDLAGARQTAAAALASTRDSSWSSPTFASPMALIAESLVALGLLADAEELIDRAESLVSSGGGVIEAHRAIQGGLCLTRGFVAELRGQPRAALEALERAQDAFAAAKIDLLQAVAWTRLASASRALGRGPAAAAALERARALAGAAAPAWFADLLALADGAPALPQADRAIESVYVRLARAVAGATAVPAHQRYVLTAGGRTLIDPRGRRIDLGRRRAVGRVLRALAAAAPAPVSVHDLFSAAWSAQTASHESARNRVYVALSTLRGLGAADLVESTGDGYRVAAGMELRVEEA